MTVLGSTHNSILMDELLDALAGGFTVSAIPNCTAAPHPRFSQYKSKNSNANQEKRRRRYLELQKQWALACILLSLYYFLKLVSVIITSFQIFINNLV